MDNARRGSTETEGMVVSAFAVPQNWLTGENSFHER